MVDNALRLMDRLEVDRNTLNSFLEFENLFINQYAPLDDRNIAQYKYCKLQQYGSVQKYIAAFDNIVVVLPELAKEDAIHAFINSLKLGLKCFFKA